MTKKSFYKQFEFTIIATDVIIFTVKEDQLQVLLIKMKKDPYLNHWAAPGGRVKPTESLDEAATRHLYNQTGVKDVYLEQLYTFGEISRDPFGRVVSVAYFALIPTSKLQPKTGGEHGEGVLFPISKLPPLAYDHREMIKVAVDRLKAKLGYTNIIYSLLPREFTHAELQKMYEIILERELDKRNFRRKILSLNLIEEVVGKTKMDGAHRPAQLYRFKKREPQMVEIL